NTQAAGRRRPLQYRSAISTATIPRAMANSCCCLQVMTRIYTATARVGPVQARNRRHRRLRRGHKITPLIPLVESFSQLKRRLCDGSESNNFTYTRWEISRSSFLPPTTGWGNDVAVPAQRGDELPEKQSSAV